MSKATRALSLVGIAIAATSCGTYVPRRAGPPTTASPQPPKPTYAVSESVGPPGTKIAVAGNGCALAGVHSGVIVGLTTPNRQTLLTFTQVETVQRRPWDAALIVPTHARPGRYSVNAMCMRDNLTAFDYPSAVFTVIHPRHPTALPRTN